MRSFSVAARGTTKASPKVVWELVADAPQYARWGPWDRSGYEGAARGVGHTRALRRGHTTTVEKVVELEEQKRLVYTVLKGLPVRNYRAEVSLGRVPSGTEITWSARWDRTIRGWFVEKALRRFFPQMMGQLVAAADQAATATTTVAQI
ncbi:MAG TPA: SRPBCC family protein [Acidimicrobiales bacterium]|nr:SRPBCC family protein [Acidimicrobiales bacterium]